MTYDIKKITNNVKHDTFIQYDEFSVFTFLKITIGGFLD